MSNKTRRARLNDLRVGRTLFVTEWTGVMKVKITRVQRKSMGVFFYYDTPWGESRFSAGDMGVPGECYDHRPCMVFTNMSAAIANRPLMDKWVAEVNQRNAEWDRDFPEWDGDEEEPAAWERNHMWSKGYFDCPETYALDPGSMYELVRDIGGSGS